MFEDDLITVFRSAQRRECNERLLVLTAVGVEAVITAADGAFLLRVAPHDAGYAVRHLLQYDAENRPPPPPPLPPPVYGHAWVGCAIYVLVLVGVAWVLSNGLVRLDAFDLGELDAARVQAGEWWRAWTALTLHLDAPHLAANLGAGTWFGYLAARQMGSGTAWLITVTGAALANLLEGLLAPPPSTARWALRPRCSAHSAPCRLTPGASVSRCHNAGRAAGVRSLPG